MVYMLYGLLSYEVVKMPILIAFIPRGDNRVGIPKPVTTSDDV